MTSYAIIEAGGLQWRVEPGRFYDINRLPAEPDTQITIDKVLFVQNDGDITVGQPFVEGVTVEATVLQHLRDRKIIVYKMRPKKKTRKKQGHRQELTRLMIDSINFGGSSSKSAETVVPTAALEPVVVEPAALEPVAVAPTEPEPVAVAPTEPEPVVIAAAEPEPVVVEPAALEPEAVAAAEPEPEVVEPAAALEPEVVEPAAELEPVDAVLMSETDGV